MVDQVTDDIAQQLKLTQDVKLAMRTILADYSQKYKDMVIKSYESPELKSIYNGLRAESQISKKKTHRQLLKIPNAYVLHFLHDMFVDKYGDNWLSDKQTLLKVMRNEELIKPWITVKRI